MRRAKNSVMGPKIPIWNAPLIGFNKDSNFQIAGPSDGERLFFWQSFDEVRDGDDNGDFWWFWCWSYDMCFFWELSKSISTPHSQLNIQK